MLSPSCEPPCPIQAPTSPASLAAHTHSSQPALKFWPTKHRNLFRTEAAGHSLGQLSGPTRRPLAASPEFVKREFLEFESVEFVPPRHFRQGPEVSKSLFSPASHPVPASRGGPSIESILTVLETVSIPATLFRQFFFSPPASVSPLPLGGIPPSATVSLFLIPKLLHFDLALHSCTSGPLTAGLIRPNPSRPALLRCSLHQLTL